MLLLYNMLVSNRAEALVAGVAVEAAPVLAQGGVVLFHIPIPAVHGQGKCETMGVCYTDTQSVRPATLPWALQSPVAVILSPQTYHSKSQQTFYVYTISHGITQIKYQIEKLKLGLFTMIGQGAVGVGWLLVGIWSYQC